VSNRCYRMIKRYSFFQIFLLFFVIPCQAALYQVGPTRPFTTLHTVVSLLQPGDTVEVDGNVTYPGDIVFSQPGSPTAKITIRGIRVAGQRPVLSGGTNTVTFATPPPYSGPGADHYIFEGFEITQGTFRGLYHQAHDLLVKDVLVHSCAAHGILGADAGSGSLTLDHVEVHHCGNGSTQHQIYMATDEVNHPGSVFRMQFCYVHDGNGGNNLKSRAERNEIYYNWIEGAFYHELELIGPDGGDPGLKREDSDVVGNVLWKRNSFYTIRVGGDGTGETDGRYRFVNNTIIPGSSAVFRIFDGIESIEMHNNVIYYPGGATICRTVEADWSTGVELIAGSGNWVSTGSTFIPTQWSDTEVGLDPGFIDFNNSDPRPAVGSPLLDKGSISLSGPPGYPFPGPLVSPLRHPPLHGIDPPDVVQQRPVDLRIDRGAFEGGIFWCVDRNNTSGIQNGSWTYPFLTIQTALDAAASGDKVLVACGTFQENVIIDDKAVKLLGRYPGGTETDYLVGPGGDFSRRGPEIGVTSVLGNSAAAVIHIINNGSSGSEIDGLSLSGGRHGIFLDDMVTWPPLSAISLSNNLIDANGVTNDYNHIGGGIYLSGSDIVISENIIRNNVGGRGAGIGGNSVNLRIENNLIENNISYGDHGGGVYLAGSATITGNVIRGNRAGESLGYGWGGGILILETAFLSHNQIYENHAPSIGGGVFVDESGTAVLEHELVYRNTTSAFDKGGAGIYVDGGDGSSSSAQLINCTVADNNSPGSSGGNGVYIEGNSSVEVINSIFWNNSGDDFYVQSGSSLTVTYSTSFEPIAGTGNRTDDPLFVDAANRDYHLLSQAGHWDQNELCGGGAWNVDNLHSPAIDAGNPGSMFSEEPLPNGNRINMGTYGNTAEASKSAAQGDGPVADFSVDLMSGPVPLTVHFTDLSLNLPTSWNWDFDGNCVFDASAQDPVWTYNQPGVFNVSLVATNTVGPDIETKELLICAGGISPGSVSGLELSADKVTMFWRPAGLAATYDVVKGSLELLRDNTGDFSPAIIDCLANDTTQTTTIDPESPTAGNGFFYLVRAVSCDGLSGTYDSDGSNQEAPRDLSINASAHACQ